jgi:hypothetical protein
MIPDPAGSIPNLKKRGPMFYIIVGGALVLVVVAVVIAVTTLRAPADPSACAHVEQQAEMGPEPWDAFVELLAKVVEERVTTEAGEVVRIHSQRRDDKCAEAMRKIEKNVKPEVYQAVASCVAEATNAKQAARCLGAIK